MGSMKTCDACVSLSVFISASCLLSRAAAGSQHHVPGPCQPALRPREPPPPPREGPVLPAAFPSQPVPPGEPGTVLPPVGSGSCGASRAVDTICLETDET